MITLLYTIIRIKISFVKEFEKNFATSHLKSFLDYIDSSASADDKPIKLTE